MIKLKNSFKYIAISVIILLLVLIIGYLFISYKIGLSFKNEHNKLSYKFLERISIIKELGLNDINIRNIYANNGIISSDYYDIYTLYLNNKRIIIPVKSKVRHGPIIDYWFNKYKVTSKVLSALDKETPGSVVAKFEFKESFFSNITSSINFEPLNFNSKDSKLTFSKLHANFYFNQNGFFRKHLSIPFKASLYVQDLKFIQDDNEILNLKKMELNIKQKISSGNLLSDSINFLINNITINNINYGTIDLAAKLTNLDLYSLKIADSTKFMLSDSWPLFITDKSRLKINKLLWITEQGENSAKIDLFFKKQANKIKITKIKNYLDNLFKKANVDIKFNKEDFVNLFMITFRKNMTNNEFDQESIEKLLPLVTWALNNRIQQLIDEKFLVEKDNFLLYNLKYNTRNLILNNRKYKNFQELLKKSDFLNN